MKRASLLSSSLLLFFISLLALSAHAQSKAQIIQFFSLVQAGDVARVSALVAADATLLNARDDAGGTPLHRAVFGSVPMVKWLLQQGADPNAKSDERFGARTPLHYAAFSASIKPEIISALLDGGADINVRDGSAHTLLHLAVAARNRDIAQLLRERGATDVSPIFDAIARGDHAQIARLIAANPNAVNEKNAFFPPNTREPNIVSISFNDMSPLHAAVFWGDVSIVDLLIENQAPLETRDRYGETPLHEAVKLKNLELAQLLLDKGADINAKTQRLFFLREGENDITPLHFAVQGGNAEMVELLLQRGADINAQTTLLQRTPLDWAAVDQPKLVTLLRSKGAIWGGGNPKGSASLVRAIENRKPELVIVLLEAGADANAKNSSGQTALRLAEFWGDAAVIELLIEKGAHSNAQHN